MRKLQSKCCVVRTNDKLLLKRVIAFTHRKHISAYITDFMWSQQPRNPELHIGSHALIIRSQSIVIPKSYIESSFTLYLSLAYVHCPDFYRHVRDGKKGKKKNFNLYDFFHGKLHLRNGNPFNMEFESENDVESHENRWFPDEPMIIHYIESLEYIEPSLWCTHCKKIN